MAQDQEAPRDGEAQTSAEVAQVIQLDMFEIVDAEREREKADV